MIFFLLVSFDWAFNYRTQDVRQTLRIAAPSGVDVFLDAVGGVFHSTVVEQMAPGGRVCVLGNLSAYNNPRSVPMVPANDLAVALKVGLEVWNVSFLGLSLMLNDCTYSNKSFT